MNTEDDQQLPNDPWVGSSQNPAEQPAHENVGPSGQEAGNSAPSAGQPEWAPPPIGGTQPTGMPPLSGAVWPPSPGFQGQFPGYFPYNTNAGLVLAMSVVSIFCCGVILGPIAWVMSHQGLKQIAAGQANQPIEPRWLGRVSAQYWAPLNSGRSSSGFPLRSLTARYPVFVVCRKYYSLRFQRHCCVSKIGNRLRPQQLHVPDRRQ